MNKPTSDQELKDYQELVCVNCVHSFKLRRGIFRIGCKPVDLHGMTTHDRMIGEDGVCLFYKE